MFWFGVFLFCVCLFLNIAFILKINLPELLLEIKLALISLSNSNQVCVDTQILKSGLRI